MENKEIKDNKKELKPEIERNFWNMPITMDIDPVNIHHPGIVDHNGNKYRSARDCFDLTLPGFTPAQPLHLSDNTLNEAEKIRGWNIDEQNKLSEYRKSVLKKVLNMEISAEYVLEHEIKHTNTKFKPWDHQALDAYVLKYSTNMLITHEVRVGKTITAVLGAYNNPLVKKVLVICPKIVVYNWTRTFEQWTDWKTSTFLAETKKSKKEERDFKFEQWKNGDIQVLVINSDYFSLNQAEIFAKLDNEEKENLVILDEGHFLSKRRQSPRQQLASNRSNEMFKYRLASKGLIWILSGTAARNAEYEMLSLFYLLSPTGKKNNPRQLDNYQEFFERFARITQTPQRQNGYTFEIEFKDTYQKALRELNALHRIHRNQADIWGDPGQFNTYEDVFLNPNKNQLNVYKNLKGNTDGLFLDFENPLVRDSFLRKIAVDHRCIETNIRAGIRDLINHEDQEYSQEMITDILNQDISELDSSGIEELIYSQVSERYGLKTRGAKADWVIEWIQENKERIQGNMLPDSVSLNGLDPESTEYRSKQLDGRQPVLICSFFTSFLRLFRQDLYEVFGEDLKVEIIDGSVVKEERQRIIDEFQNGEIDILLANTITIKEGVTLNRADEAIFFDRVWENVVMEQVKARIHNPSKTHPKHEMFLMLNDSIDLVVAEANQIKANNTEYVNKHVVGDVHGLKDNKVNEFFRNFSNKH